MYTAECCQGSLILGQVFIGTNSIFLSLLAYITYDRVSTGVLNFRASLYRDQFQIFGPYWYLDSLKSPYFSIIYYLKQCFQEFKF